LETTQPESQIQPEPVAEQPANWKRFVLDILETLVLAVVLYFGINAVSARVRVDGFSMRPTLQDGEYILVNKLAYKTGEPHRGDIVVFIFPVDPSEDEVSKVIDRIREAHAEFHPVEGRAAAPGDFAVADIAGSFVEILAPGQNPRTFRDEKLTLEVGHADSMPEINEAVAKLPWKVVESLAARRARKIR